MMSAVVSITPLHTKGCMPGVYTTRIKRAPLGSLPKLAAPHSMIRHVSGACCGGICWLMLSGTLHIDAGLIGNVMQFVDISKAAVEHWHLACHRRRPITSYNQVCFVKSDDSIPNGWVGG